MEGNNQLHRLRQIGDDEADAGVKLAGVPLDFGHDAAWNRPALRLIAEAGVVSPDCDRPPVNGTLEKVADTLLQDAVRRQPARVLLAFGPQELVDLGVGKGGIGAEVVPKVALAVAGHDRFEHGSPATRRMDVARTQRRTLQVAKLVEHE